MNSIDFPLDHEQTKKLLQFQDLTGIEDIAVCRDVLQRHNWNLETTIRNQMNVKEGRPSVYSFSRPASDKLPVPHNDPSVQQVCVAESHASPFRGRWTGTIGLIASFLFRIVYNTFASYFEFARCFFWNRPRYRYPLSEWLETAYTYYMHRTNALKAFTRAATKYAVMFFILVFYATLSITEGCSSRSTPKPRPAGPTPRPNITFHTYQCPGNYASAYCLNGATCFTVKIGEHLLYNCECAEGFMGPRCEFKDLDSSYLLSRKHILLETASIAFGATLAIFLVVIVCIFLYIRYHRRQKQINTKIYMY